MAGIYRKYKPLTNKQIEQGDWTRDQLIENYIPTVLKLVKRFPAKYIEKEEAISIGLIELIRCVDNAKTDSAYAFTAYVRKCIIGTIKRHCKKYYGRSVIRTKDGKNAVLTTSLVKEPLTYGEGDFDLRDTINSIVSTDVERVIINRVIEGYKQKEIAKELGVSESWTSRIKEELLNRLESEIEP